MARLDMSGLEGPALLPGEAATAPLNAFEEDPDQPRTEFEGAVFDELVEDIRQHGILQPIVVVRTAAGVLRIRFGARRFRAAKRLDLQSVPYVLSTDSRQWDDYAQVSENEKRKSLEPLELATFIAKRVKLGDTKTLIAQRLGISSTAVTFLLALINAPTPILDLYTTGRCRTLQYLYRLSRLHALNAQAVEARLAEGGEVTNSFVDQLAAEIDPKSSELAAPGGAAGASSRDIRLASASSQRPAASPNVARSPSAAAPSDRSKLRRPLLLGTHGDRAVTVLISKRPSKKGRVFIRYGDGSEDEVTFTALTLLQLTETRG